MVVRRSPFTDSVLPVVLLLLLQRVPTEFQADSLGGSFFPYKAAGYQGTSAFFFIAPKQAFGSKVPQRLPAKVSR